MFKGLELIPRGIRRRLPWAAVLLLACSASSAGDGVDPADLPAGADTVSSDLEDHLNSNHYYVAVGPVLVPDYEGSDDYEFQPLLMTRWFRAGAWVALEGSTLKANVIPASLFQVGPILRWQRSRKDVEDPRVDQMRQVSGALELGGYFGVLLRDPDDPMRRLGLRLEFLQDVSGSHEGNHGALVLEGGLPLGEDWSIGGELFTTYGSSSYMDTYFSVDADNAARSGLRRFQADAGFKDAGVRLMLSRQFTDRWGIGVIGVYTRMLGDAGSSPVVRDAGSRDQFVTGVVATWRY